VTEPADDDASREASARAAQPADAVAAAPDGAAAPATLDASSIQPLDVDGVAAIGIGTVLWLVALVVSLLLRDRLTASGDSWWIGVCVAGFLLGIPGLVFLRWRRARHAAARS
jgi:hypothetical protein